MGLCWGTRGGQKTGKGLCFSIEGVEDLVSKGDGRPSTAGRWRGAWHSGSHARPIGIVETRGKERPDTLDSQVCNPGEDKVGEKAGVDERRSYTARELAIHYARCGHRMSAKESGRVMEKLQGKYERNPMIKAAEKSRKLECAERQRNWETKGLYPEEGQRSVEMYVRRVSSLGNGK